MKSLAVALAGTAVMAVGAPAPARADPLPANGMTLSDLNSWLRGQGCQTTMVEKESAVVCQINSDNSIIVFANDCTNGSCKSIEYFAGVKYEGGGVRPDDGSAAVLVNGWNLNHRWIRASVDADRNVHLESEFLLVPKVDSDTLALSLALFIKFVPDFLQYVQTANTANPLPNPK
jgi:hypothetical protein